MVLESEQREVLQSLIHRTTETVKHHCSGRILRQREGVAGLARNA